MAQKNTKQKKAKQKNTKQNNKVVSNKKESSEQVVTEGKNANLTNFVGETKEELGKVVWPSRQQLLSESTAVLLMVILVATVIYLVDNFFSWGAGKVF